MDNVVDCICLYCGVGWGQRIYVADAEVTQTEDNPDSPISGASCVRRARSASSWCKAPSVLPALGIGAPTWRYGRQAIAIDMIHHSVYVGATNLTYAWLENSRSRP